MFGLGKKKKKPDTDAFVKLMAQNFSNAHGLCVDVLGVHENQMKKHELVIFAACLAVYGMVTYYRESDTESFANEVFSASINGMVMDPEVSLNGAQLAELTQQRYKTYQHFITAAMTNKSSPGTSPVITLAIDLFENVKDERYEHGTPRLSFCGPAMVELLFENDQVAKSILA